MSGDARPNGYGEFTGPASVMIRRRLPGPIERVWAYLVDEDKRRQWLASGPMEARAGTTFTLVWRNDELTEPPGTRPPGFSDEHSMECRVTACEKPRRLAFTWGEGTEVTITLVPDGDAVLLTILHERLPDRPNLLGVSAGWHAHLDVLVARLHGRAPAPFWDAFTRLRAEYGRRLPA